MSTALRPNPKDISQGLLDRTGRALLTGDAVLFLPCFITPHRISTFDDVRLLETEQDLTRLFLELVETLRKQGVTDLVRTCVSADYKASDLIEATHVSHVMNKNTLLQEPYPSFSVLRCVDDFWRCESSEYAVPPGSIHARALERAGISMAAIAPKHFGGANAQN